MTYELEKEKRETIKAREQVQGAIISIDAILRKLR